MISLRPYQLSAVEETRVRLRAGKRRLLFVLPTGGGKTVVASHVVSSAIARGKHVLFVAHRRELIKQAFCKLIRNGLDPRDVGIVMAGTESKLVDDIAPAPETLSDAELWRIWARRRPVARVQVASIDTLRNRNKPPADLLIIDEAHRALSSSYVTLAGLYPSAVLLGLTATPYRADGRGLDELFDDLVVVASPRTLIDDGFLVEPTVWTRPAASLPNLEGVKVRGGDYDAKELDAAVDRDGLVGDIVEHWRKHAAGIRTVAFPCSVKHSKHLVSRFVEAGIPAEHLDGETPTPDRDAILARLERGETLVVSSCGVLCEGWDQPSVKCAILARPTKSTGLYLQCAGRILRPFQGQKAVILDHAGCALEHGLPQDDREFSLEGKKKKAKKASPAKTCPGCLCVLARAARVCPECGFEFPLEAEGRDVPEEKNGELEQARPKTEQEKLVDWGAVVAEWRRKNERRAVPLAPGWCFYRFREKYKGASLPRGACAPEFTAAERARRAEFDALKNQGVEPHAAHALMAVRRGETPARPPELVPTSDEVVEWAV